MPNAPLYPEAKPFDGDVLILCEGDAVSYESQLLKAWADTTNLNGRFVKAMSCGTTTALLGMADAVGRTIPIIVVEDRDFRTLEEARKECDKNLKNREDRNVAMRGWVSWQRAEIENYFTDDSVLPPVFGDVFECDEDDVRAAVRSALSELTVAQALEYALYRARKSWLSTDANRALRVQSVQWNARGRTRLSAEEVRNKLTGRLDKWQKSLHDGSTWEDPMAGQQLLADFDTKCNDWSNLAYEESTWRRDWGCKEVIKHVRMTLAQSKPGWWSTAEHPEQSVKWGSMKDDKTRDAHDRFLERTIQPKLVKAVTAQLSISTPFDLRAELDNLAAIIRTV
ncbi:MAG: hypothetical protein WD894_14055 [Pirellulales bacterium]